MKSMATDLYKQQSNMLHEWMNTTSLEEKKRPGKKDNFSWYCLHN